MEAIFPLVAGVGAVGVVFSWIVGLTFLFVIPFLAIVDCAATSRHEGSRVVIVIFLVLTWSLGGVIYALFFAGARALRIFTAVFIVALLGIAALSMTSCLIGAQQANEQNRVRSEQRAQQVISDFAPAVTGGNEMAPFPALLCVDGKRSITSFTLKGPDAAAARGVDPRVQHIAVDPAQGRTFAVTRHDFGAITPSTGNFTRIEVDPDVHGFSWPKGITFDSLGQRVVVMTSHVMTRFFTFDPSSSDWQRLPAEHRDLSLQALACPIDDGCLYALAHERGARSLTAIHRFSSQGALTATVLLDPAIPLSGDESSPLQLHAVRGRLVVILPYWQARDGSPQEAASGIFAVDPSLGSVSRVERLRGPVEAPE